MVLGLAKTTLITLRTAERVLPIELSGAAGPDMLSFIFLLEAIIEVRSSKRLVVPSPIGA